MKFSKKNRTHYLLYTLLNLSVPLYGQSNKTSLAYYNNNLALQL